MGDKVVVGVGDENSYALHQYFSNTSGSVRQRRPGKRPSLPSPFPHHDPNRMHYACEREHLVVVAVVVVKEEVGVCRGNRHPLA